MEEQEGCGKSLPSGDRIFLIYLYDRSVCSCWRRTPDWATSTAKYFRQVMMTKAVFSHFTVEMTLRCLYSWTAQVQVSNVEPLVFLKKIISESKYLCSQITVCLFLGSSFSISYFYLQHDVEGSFPDKLNNLDQHSLNPDCEIAQNVALSQI